MGTLSFKSVGRTASSIQQNAVTTSPIPIGIKTPLRLSNENGPLQMNFSLADQISDNLRNLLQTNWGERLGLYDFGANLRPLVVNYSSQDTFDSEAVASIATAVGRWMPYIELVDFSSVVNRQQNQQTGVIEITIGYNIPSLDISNKKIQVVLYVI